MKLLLRPLSLTLLALAGGLAGLPDRVGTNPAEFPPVACVSASAWTAALTPTGPALFAPAAYRSVGGSACTEAPDPVELLDNSDLVVRGHVLDVDPLFAARLRRIRLVVESTIKGSAAPGDTISILQISPPSDPYGSRYLEWAFSPGQYLDVYLTDVSGPPYQLGDVYDSSQPDIPLPTGTFYYVWALEDGVVVPGGAPAPARLSAPRENGPASIGALPDGDCCVWIEFLDTSLECGARGPAFSGLELLMEEGVFAKIQSAIEYASDACRIKVVRNRTECAGRILLHIVIGQPPAKGPDGEALEPWTYGEAPASNMVSHSVGGACKMQDIYVYSASICRKWIRSDTPAKMIQMVANVAVHEAGHGFGAPHGDAGVMWAPRGNPPADASTTAYGYSEASKRRLRDCCCPGATLAPHSTWGRLKSIYR